MPERIPEAVPPEASARKKIVIVEASDAVEAEARDVAEAKMTASPEELSGIGGFVKRIWKHNLFHEYYRQKEIGKARSQILETGNLYAGETAGREQWDEAQAAIVQRFTSEYEGTIHEGEKPLEALGETEEANRVKTEIQRIIRDYAAGRLDDTTFVEERNRVFSALKGIKPETVDKGVFFADNLYEIARQVKQNADHGVALREEDLDFEIVVGKAKAGVRTEAQFNAVDRVVEKITSSKVGRFANETTIASGVALAYAASVGLSRRIAGSKLAAWGTFGATALLGGGIAALRERKRLEEERRQHSREMAKGKRFDPDRAPRRREMEEYRYETRNAADLCENLERSLYAYEGGRRESRNLNEGEYRAALGQLAEIEARIKISDRDKIDLISYSDAAKVEQERLRLDIARAEAKVALRRMAAANPDILRRRSFDATLTSVAEMRIGDLTNDDEGIKDKNDLFKKMKRKRVAVAAVKGIATGLLIGGLAQEATTFLSDQQHGLIERFFKGDQAGSQPKPGFTPLEFLRRWWSGELPKGVAGGGGTFEKIVQAGTGNLRLTLPAGADLVFSQSDGTHTLMFNGSPYISGIKLNPDGTLTKDAADLFTAKGIAVQQSVDQIQRMVPDTVTSGPKEVVDKRPDLFKTIKRVLWYDNDTPKPVFDKNELRLHWGEKGVGIDAKGNFVYDINAMTPDGSYHKNFSVDAQQAMKAGKLKLMISLSQDTQHRVFQVPIGADGRAVFDPNSEVGKMVFKEINGKAQFLGRFAEVAEVVGEKDGVERMRILATHEGKGLDTVTEAIQRPVIEQSPKLIIGAPPEGDYQVLPPPVIPMFGRRPLEPIIHGPSPDGPPHPAPYGYERGQEGMKKMYTEISEYRSAGSEPLMRPLIQKIENDPALLRKYGFVLKRLDKLQRYGRLTTAERGEFKNELERYNRRRYGKEEKNYIKLPEFIGREIVRTHQHIENILLEETQVGSKPFSREFYRTSPIVKGLDRAEEVVVILDGPIGDAVLTTPVVKALDAYFAQNGMGGKNIKVVTRHPGLLKCLEDGQVQVISEKNAKSYFRAAGRKERFIINAHKSFEDYGIFGLSERDAGDLSRVMSVDWASWTKEEVPTSPGRRKKYDPIPARILRDFEIMAGTKLFPNINGMNHFLEKQENFEDQARRLRVKYNIRPGEKVVVVATSAGVTPKEWKPELWKELISDMHQKYPDVHILWLENITNPEKRRLYGEVADDLARSEGVRVSRVDEDLDYMNTIMSMADLSITTDTGFGHLSGALGKPNVMFTLNDPVQWSTAKTLRVTHPKAHQIYGKGFGTYDVLWQHPEGYYVNDNGKMIGASDIPPSQVLRTVDRVLQRA